MAAGCGVGSGKRDLARQCGVGEVEGDVGSRCGRALRGLQDGEYHAHNLVALGKDSHLCGGSRGEVDLVHHHRVAVDSRVIGPIELVADGIDFAAGGIVFGVGILAANLDACVAHPHLLACGGANAVEVAIGVDAVEEAVAADAKGEIIAGSGREGGPRHVGIVYGAKLVGIVILRAELSPRGAVGGLGGLYGDKVDLVGKSQTERLALGLPRVGIDFVEGGGGS